jgi:tetratricopeptide (TPR) repeat protein
MATKYNQPDDSQDALLSDTECEVRSLLEAGELYERVKALTDQDPVTATLIEEAQELALSIEDEFYQALALVRVVSAYLASDDRDRAQQIALTILTADEKATVLLKVAESLLKAKQPERAVAVLNEARPVARTIDVPPDQAYALGRIAELLNRAGVREQAYEVWNEAIAAAQAAEADSNEQYGLDSSGVLLQVAQALAGAGDMQMARQVADSIRNKARRRQALKHLDALRTD